MTLRRAIAVLGATLLLGLVPVLGSATPAFAATAVNGGGSSFQAPEALQWAADTARAPYNLNINYVTSSSGAGRDNYAQGLYDFGATDVIYNLEDGNFEQQARQQHPFKYVTVSAGGLAFQYNIVVGGARFTGLDLTPAEICGIFTGEITNWSQLAGTTGDAILASFNEPIEAVVRSDSAGESYVLSQFCIATEPGEWNTFKNWVNANNNSISYSDPNMNQGLPVSFWPGTLYNNDHDVNPQSGATAASEAVANPSTGDGSITYEASAYAKQIGAPVASVENPAGYFVQPDANSVQIALSYAHRNSAGTFNLDFNGKNRNAYFPSTYSYVVDPSTTKTPDPGINAELNKYLCFSIGLGQQQAAPLLYAPLSAQVTAISVAAIESTPDAPPRSQCGVGGPKPDVAANGGGIKGNNGKGAGSSTTGSKPTGPVKAQPGSTTSPSIPGVTGSGTTSSNGGSTSAAGSTTSSGGKGAGTGSSTGKSGSTATSGGSTTPGSSSTGVTVPSSGSAGSGVPAAVTPVAAASSTTPSGNPPISDSALWWLLGGVVIAAVLSYGSSRRRGVA